MGLKGRRLLRETEQWFEGETIFFTRATKNDAIVKKRPRSTPKVYTENNDGASLWMNRSHLNVDSWGLPNQGTFRPKSKSRRKTRYVRVALGAPGRSVEGKLPGDSWCQPWTSH